MQKSMTLQDNPCRSIHKDELADIRNVNVDKSLPREMRIADFIKQIRNPYYFRCGKFTVTAKYADNGVSLEDCLKGILL